MRWIKRVGELEQAFINLDGDILVSAGAVSYLGVFTSDYRKILMDEWSEKIAEFKIPHTPGAGLIQTMANPVVLRHWTLCGLPTDDLSSENGIMMDTSKRWPLLIDPQGQGNSFIKRLGGVHVGQDGPQAEYRLEVAPALDRLREERHPPGVSDIFAHFDGPAG